MIHTSDSTFQLSPEFKRDCIDPIEWTDVLRKWKQLDKQQNEFDR